MMKTNVLRLKTLFVLTIALQSFAAPQQSPSVQYRWPKGVSFCPHPKQLYKVNLHWKAQHGTWISTNPSFSKHIKRFTSAHWSGVQLGTILCTYIGQSATTFPITLEYNRFVEKPTFSTWQNDGKGLSTCIGHTINACPYVIARAKKPDDIKQLEHLKSR